MIRVFMKALTSYSKYENEPIGNGNPYYMCSECKLSDPQINGFILNHKTFCSYYVNLFKETLTEEEFSLYYEELKKRFSKLDDESLAELTQVSKMRLIANLEEFSGFSFNSLLKYCNLHSYKDPLLILGLLHSSTLAVNVKGDRQLWEYKKAKEWAESHRTPEILAKIYS